MTVEQEMEEILLEVFKAEKKYRTVVAPLMNKMKVLSQGLDQEERRAMLQRFKTNYPQYAQALDAMLMLFSDNAVNKQMERVEMKHPEIFKE